MDTSQITRGDRAFLASALRVFVSHAIPEFGDVPGQGYPVVLVHGIPTSPKLWRRVLPRLRGARALAWEMVGYGASIPEGRRRDISVAKQADYLAAWLRQLGVDRAVLVGHDLGGGVVQIAAAHKEESGGKGRAAEG